MGAMVTGKVLSLPKDAAMTMNVMHPNIMVIALRLTMPPAHQEVLQTMCRVTARRLA